MFESKKKYAPYVSISEKDALAWAIEYNKEVATLGGYKIHIYKEDGVTIYPSMYQAVVCKYGELIDARAHGIVKVTNKDSSVRIYDTDHYLLKMKIETELPHY